MFTCCDLGCVITQFHGDLNALNKQNQTPLFVAVEQGHSTMTEYLVAEGADTDIADSDGDTPLHVCLKKAQFVQNESPQLLGMVRRCSAESLIGISPGIKTKLGKKYAMNL